MKVFYNDNNDYACCWLSNLMDAGEISSGKIDDRDIRQITASDLEGYDRVHLFAGIGGWEQALKISGWDNGKFRSVWTASCPCPPFSVAGKKLDAQNAKAKKLSGILSKQGLQCVRAAGMNGNAIKDTCGQRFTDLSENANLQSYLESKLAVHPGLIGSQVCEVVWKASDMIVGRPIYQLRASVRRILDNGCGGLQDFKNWSTPKVSDSNGERVNRTPRRDGNEFSAGLNDQVVKVNWPSPKAHDPNGLSPQGRGYGPALQDAAAWATPTARDWRDSAGMSETGINPNGTVRNRLDQLPRQVMKMAWGTPRTDHGGNPKNLGDGKGRLEDQVFGVMLNGENVKKENIGKFRLSPAFSLWLMGYPPQWMATAPSAEGVRYKVREMRLCHK